MTIAWRIVKAVRLPDAFTGEGARQASGRWNYPGTVMVYTAGSLALAALEVVRGEPERRVRLHALMARLKAGLTARGFDVARVVSPIFPVVLGSEARAVAAARGLRERGFFVRAIRPPTVPRGTSRLRVALTAGHRPEQLDAFLGALDEVVATLPPG